MVTPHFQNIRSAILEALAKAHEEILVAIYWFTNQELFNLLCDKLKHGVNVSLIIHNDYINNRTSGLNFQNFIDNGGNFYFSDPTHPMHNKFCIIDKTILVNGSYNWTYYAEDKNSENILIIENEEITILAFHNEFGRLLNQLKRTVKIRQLQKSELEEFNSLNSRDYLANDIIYQAKDLNQPELIQEAFNISPNNIKVQETAVALEMQKKRKLKCSVGAGIKGDKYLIGVKKGTIIPIILSELVGTSEDNQTSCTCPLYYGENEIASYNKKMSNTSSNRQPSGLVLHGLSAKPMGETKMKMIFSIDILGHLLVRLYALDTGKMDLYTEDISRILEEA